MIASIAAYHFVPVEDPYALAADVEARAREAGLLGSVIVAEEGINLFLAGESHALRAFAGWMRADVRFRALVIKASESRVSPFARLKVKVKPEIIAFRRETALAPGARSPAVAPTDLARWIGRGCDDGGRRLLLLDTRNREEVAYGTFDGALTLPIDNFTELPGAVVPYAEAFAGATVVSFCTGGIRCEKAAPWMRAHGMSTVLQLDGGILGYFEAAGGFGYRGDCFVFDRRIALDPGLRARADGQAADLAQAA